MERIFIFDTTLRDGEQAPGASMTLDQKLAVARQLEILGVDIIEAGFPVSSPYQFETVQAVAAEIRNATIAALARAVRNDIDKAAESIRKACSGRIHTFIATSPIHMEYKLKKTPDEVLAMYSGKRGAERLLAKMRKLEEAGGRFAGHRLALEAMGRVREALRRFWHAVADFLHIRYTSAEEVADRVLSDLLEGVNPLSFMGRRARSM